MKAKMKIKMGIDFLMTVLLFLLMSYQITGQELHEWFGAEMLVLFLLHNILNIRWYGSLFKGKYTLLRIMQMIINISVLISMLCLGFSGVVMSRHVFAGLSIHGPMATARTMHLAASYWGFVLISIHLGFHWRMILGLFPPCIRSFVHSVVSDKYSRPDPAILFCYDSVLLLRCFVRTAVLLPDSRLPPGRSVPEMQRKSRWSIRLGSTHPITLRDGYRADRPSSRIPESQGVLHPERKT